MKMQIDPGHRRHKGRKELGLRASFLVPMTGQIERSKKQQSGGLLLAASSMAATQ